jgi:hypothetical protein
MHARSSVGIIAAASPHRERRQTQTKPIGDVAVRSTAHYSFSPWCVESGKARRCPSRNPLRLRSSQSWAKTTP